MPHIEPSELQLVHPARHEWATPDDRRKIPSVPGKSGVTRVKVQKRAIAIACNRLRVDLNGLCPQAAPAYPEGPANHAPDPVATYDDAGPETSPARLQENSGRTLVAHALHTNTIAHRNTSRRCGSRQRVVEFAPPDDAADGSR